MTVRQLVGGCRAQLATLEPGSIQACITSPPYYGLRSYGTPDLVWGGDPEHAHAFGTAIPGENRGGSGTFNGRNGRGENYGRDAARGQSCACGAWLGSLGLEPTPDLYVDHIVECFHHVRRVLRDDGTLWVNLGDSYAGSGKGPSGQNGIGDQSGRQGWEGSRHNRPSGGLSGGKTTVDVSLGGQAAPGYKPKDLMMIPFRVAMALQADGWYLRSVIPWLKRNSMPESVTDRPSTSVEYVFLLSKSSRYYWDADAIRTPNVSADDPRNRAGYLPSRGSFVGGGVNDGRTRTSGPSTWNPAGRNRRNGDWFFESWQGLMLDEQDDPLALVVNPQPFKQSHFATFAPKLVEPMVKASTSERGQCPECGAPWVRVVERGNSGHHCRPGCGHLDADFRDGWDGGRYGGFTDTSRVTGGWQPTCEHAAEPVPQTVLDPFGGSGTVALVADRLGRNAVLVDLKPEYSAMAVDRLTGDAPMFVEVTEAPA